MEQRKETYYSYLLRLWRTSDPQQRIQNDLQPVWRASLEGSFSGGRKAFASLEELFNFLRQQTGGQTGQEEDNN